VAGERAIPDTLEARYANYFNVGYNLHEFLFDFGQFHSRDGREGGDSGRVAIMRIVMGPCFAKAFVQMLGQAIDEYERKHGQIGV
jgi:uncharacterized protein DUF3467